jgi:hypothetical protein
MPRRPRIKLAGLPQHVVQRGIESGVRLDFSAMEAANDVQWKVAA